VKTASLIDGCAQALGLTVFVVQRRYQCKLL